MTIAVTHSTPADSSFSSTGAAAWNADHTLTGVGTIAEQDANAVAITGGSINGTTVGSTTPAAGTFTTLTATGQTSLGGAAGSESLRVLTPSATGAWADIQSVSSSAVHISSNASSGNVDLVFNSRASGSFRFRTAGSLEQLRITNTASAVNYVQVTGAATTVAPQISAQGSDTNVGFSVSSKGTGTMSFYTNSVNVNSRHLDITHTGSVVNRFQLTGAITGNGVTLGVNGSDTNISQVFQSKGTGAIDLAAGSSGVNISNGGTVTALTRTGVGSGYTSSPTVVISAPTTAGGVQATATVPIVGYSPTVSAGGTGYTVNDILTVSGGTFSSLAMQVTVSAVSGGVITAVTLSRQTDYTVAPSNPVSVTGGTGTGATFNITWGISTPITITNAGSGYVEQPTVSFSGGGGSGAAAYAVVGATSVLRNLSNTLQFQTPGGTQFAVSDSAATSNAYWQAVGGAGTADLRTAGGSVSSGAFSTQTAIPLVFRTNFTEQLRVAHTASAVNYVQVTGAATGSAVQITTQGSDTNVGAIYGNKGAGSHSFRTQGTTSIQFQVTHTTNAVNRLEVTGGASGVSPVLSALGSDTNIDLTLTPKGTGNVRFGTYTASMALTVQGYIEIKDSGGTVRKLAVVA